MAYTSTLPFLKAADSFCYGLNAALIVIRFYFLPKARSYQSFSSSDCLFALFLRVMWTVSPSFKRSAIRRLNNC